MLENKLSQSSASLTILIITFFFIMQNLSAVLVFLLATLTPVLCCDWLSHYDNFTNKSMTLLRLMGAHNNSSLPFPYKFYSHIENNTVESQLVFIRDSLELIEGLYRPTLSNDPSSVAWDTDMTDFLNVLQTQKEDISSCPSMKRPADSRLRKYYRRLETLLHTGGSSASWEMIRKVTETHLYQLNLLVNFMLEKQKQKH